MSKLRQDVPMATGDLASEPERDLVPFVIFTQLKAGGPYVYAGWLDAADDEMALCFAREHYGQDQKCTAIWAAPREFVAGMRINAQASTEEVPRRPYQIFIQKEAGDQHVSDCIVEATCAQKALDDARAQGPGAPTMHNLWAVPCTAIIATDEDDLIWRHTDQSYRLARGYSRAVREKWEKIRSDRDLTEYEKDDLQATF